MENDFYCSVDICEVESTQNKVFPLVIWMVHDCAEKPLFSNIL